MAARTDLTLPSPEVLGRTAHLYRPGTRHRPGTRRPYGVLEWHAMLRLLEAEQKTSGFLPYWSWRRGHWPAGRADIPRGSEMQQPSPGGGRRRPLLLLAATLPLLTAQSPGPWPSRPLRFVVPFAAGGNSDVTARLFGAFISQRLGQPVVVENRSGATGAIGTEAVIRSRPDGYTLLFGSPGSIINGPLLQGNPSL